MCKFKVSIIIPFYNDEKYLKDAVNSLLNQTLKDIEVILIDDGSTDRSSTVAKKYADHNENIVYVRQENFGQGIARNKGLNLAKGKYIYFLDSDDYLTEGTMEKCYTLAEINNADIITFNSKTDKIDSSNFTVDYSSKRFYKTHLEGVSYLYESLNQNKLAVPVWLYFYKAEYLRSKKIQFLPVLYEDKIFTIQLLLNNPKIVYLNEILHYRRIREYSTMTQKKNIKHLKGAYENVLFSYNEYLKIKDESLLKLEMLNLVKRNINIFVGILRAIDNNKEKKELKSKGYKLLLKNRELFSWKNLIKLKLA